MNLEAEADIAQLKRLKAAFDKLPLKLQRKIIREETRKAAKSVLLPALKNKVPKKSGRLRRALAIRAIKRARNKVGVRMALTSSKFQAKSLREAARGLPFYAGFLEYGWRVGKRTKRHQILQQRARQMKKEGASAIEVQRWLDIVDERPRVEGKSFMADTAKQFGETAAGVAARGMAGRIEQEMKAS